jgi:hypothetical protein
MVAIELNIATNILSTEGHKKITGFINMDLIKAFHHYRHLKYRRS